MKVVTVLLYPVAEKEGVQIGLWRAQGLESDIQADGIGPLGCKKAFLVEVERKMHHWAGRLDYMEQAPKEHFEAAVNYTKQSPLLPVWRENQMFDKFYVRFLEKDFY